MLIGTVINTLEIKRRNPQLEHQNILLVKSMEALTPALDLVGAEAGDRVLVVSGEAARHYCQECPSDAAVVAILDTAATE